MGKSWACCAALVALVAPLHGAAHAMTTTKIAWTMAANQANRSVVWGSARFTVLTPRLIRLEYSGSFPPRFDDLPSTLVLNRAPGAAPAFTHAIVRIPDSNDIALTLNTSALSLRFIAGAFKETTEHLPVQNAKSVARLQHKTFVETTVRGSMDLDSGDDSPRRCGKSGGSEAAIV